MNLQFAQKAFIQADDKVLLVRKSADDPFNPDCWELPGGRLKAYESPDEALRREIREEVDLEVTPGRPLAMWSWRLGDAPDSPMVIAVSRLCKLESGTPSLSGLEDDDYISEYGWFTVSDVVKLNIIPGARSAIEESMVILGLM